MSNPEITLEGRIGTDITVRDTGKGKVAKFRVVTNDRKQIDGQWQDVNTTGWSVECWGDNIASKVDAHLEKGDPIVVTGKIMDDSWTDQEGKVRRDYVVKANKVALDVALAKQS